MLHTYLPSHKVHSKKLVWKGPLSKSLPQSLSVEKESLPVDKKRYAVTASSCVDEKRYGERVRWHRKSVWKSPLDKKALEKGCEN